MKRRLLLMMSLLALFSLNTGLIQSQNATSFRSEDVTFLNDDITLAGTLTLPHGPGPHPAIIVISGSGEQNRDGEVEGFMPGYAPLRFLAEGLTPEGFAVLRYDERGIGQSTGIHHAASSADFASDAEAAIDYLLSREVIDPDQIGLIGHSEGSNIVALVAADNPQLAFAISMAGQAVNGYELLIAQTIAVLEASGASQEEINASLETGLNEWHMVLSEDWAGIEALARDLFATLPDDQRPGPDIQDALIAQQDTFAKTWFSFFLTYNPADDWTQVTAPVLVIMADKDKQVPVVQNYPKFTLALENGVTSHYDIVILENTNHLFQAGVETGALEEYAELEPVFTPDLIPTILDWLLEFVTLA